MKSVLFVLCFLYTPAFFQESHCDLKKNIDDIKVYTCKTEQEKFKTLKAEFVLHNISTTVLENYLLNVENYPSWQYNMVEAELIQKIDENKISYRSEVDAPWPVENREMFMYLTIKRDPTHQRLIIETENFETSQPLKGGVVRVPFMHGVWTVINNGQDLQVEYLLKIDPGGSVPAWLVNMAMAEGPYISFRNLKSQLEK